MKSIDPSVFIADGVQLYGKIEVAKGASLWPNAVIRAESEQVSIGAFSNLQDFAMVHIGYTDPTVIGSFCSVTHHATVHGATIGDHCLIGINAVVMDGAVVGQGSIIAPGAVVREGSEIPPHSIVAGVPGKVIKTRDSSAENRLNAWQYYLNACAFKRGEYRAWDGPDYLKWLSWIREEIAAGRDLAPDFDPRA